MRWIKKNGATIWVKREEGEMPISLQMYVKQKMGSYESLEKEFIKQALLKEQENLCAYCQQKINVDSMQIEHHCEQSICTDRTLDYTNFLAVCDGKGENETHCDTKKAEIARKDNPLRTELLPIDVNPTIRIHANSFDYKSSGLLEIENPKHKREIETVLNLNCETLKKSRKKAWKNILKETTNASNRKGQRNLPEKLKKAKIRRLCETAILDNFPFKGVYEFILKRHS
jgi:uncharacterized protein (TIGR02646 family)